MEAGRGWVGEGMLIGRGRNVEGGGEGMGWDFGAKSFAHNVKFCFEGRFDPPPPTRRIQMYLKFSQGVSEGGRGREENHDILILIHNHPFFLFIFSGRFNKPGLPHIHNYNL